MGAPTPPSGSPKRSRPSSRNEEKIRFLLAYELRKQRVTRLALTGMDDNGRTDGLRPIRAPLHFATRLAVL